MTPLLLLAVTFFGMPAGPVDWKGCEVTQHMPVDFSGGGTLSSIFSAETLRCPGRGGEGPVDDAFRLVAPDGKEVAGFEGGVVRLQRYRFRAGRDFLVMALDGPHGSLPVLLGWLHHQVVEFALPDFAELTRAAHLREREEVRDRAFGYKIRGKDLIFEATIWPRDMPMAAPSGRIEATVKPDVERGTVYVLRARRLPL